MQCLEMKLQDNRFRQAWQEILARVHPECPCRRGIFLFLLPCLCKVCMYIRRHSSDVATKYIHQVERGSCVAFKMEMKVTVHGRKKELVCQRVQRLLGYGCGCLRGTLAADREIIIYYCCNINGRLFTLPHSGVIDEQHDYFLVQQQRYITMRYGDWCLDKGGAFIKCPLRFESVQR
ncbi:hypothetical protein K504DRAFT_190263 [Pleomassaria siparia CBS 279.74]|uniref:Uncharacterized protein n=1 Tax=Pleomassaria siparia CBS 279.74 TaxID=1314801 RepID=A0A6G1JQD6_9PLEO|nr:hypothetical protein K504DRAFT_190263 [Pleomassaria siparia CBS 279.74]